MLQSASIDKPVRIVRPLVVGFVVVDHGMKSACATLVPMSEEYVYSKQYIEIIFSWAGLFESWLTLTQG